MSGTEGSDGPNGARAFALAAARLASETRCERVVVLDLRGRSPVTQFFVIANGTSPRQMRAVADELSDLGKRSDHRPWRNSGREGAKWILVDFVDVVAHVFDADTRDIYDLENYWGDCPRIDWRAELGLPEQVVPAPGDDAYDTENDTELAMTQLDNVDIDNEEDQDEPQTHVPVVVELPSMEDGDGNVELVEVDPPIDSENAERKFPSHIAQDESDDRIAGMRPVAKDSLDTDERAMAAEAAADADVTAVSDEDLPADRIITAPLPGASAMMSEDVGQEEDDELDEIVDRADSTRPTKAEKTVMVQAEALLVSDRTGERPKGGGIGAKAGYKSSGPGKKARSVGGAGGAGTARKQASRVGAKPTERGAARIVGRPSMRSPGGRQASARPGAKSGARMPAGAGSAGAKPTRGGTAASKTTSARSGRGAAGPKSKLQNPKSASSTKAAGRSKKLAAGSGRAVKHLAAKPGIGRKTTGKPTGAKATGGKKSSTGRPVARSKTSPARRTKGKS